MQPSYLIKNTLDFCLRGPEAGTPVPGQMRIISPDVYRYLNEMMAVAPEAVERDPYQLILWERNPEYVRDVLAYVRPQKELPDQTPLQFFEWDPNDGLPDAYTRYTGMHEGQVVVWENMLAFWLSMKDKAEGGMIHFRYSRGAEMLVATRHSMFAPPQIIGLMRRRCPTTWQTFVRGYAKAVQVNVNINTMPLD